ncbi:hypothetical protein ACHAWT_006183 [Skeletonema menzelii]
MADDKIMNEVDGPNNNDENKSSDNNDAASDIATATDSYEDDEYDDDDLSQDSYQDDDRGRPLPMPPLKYARIMGSLPRDKNKHTLSCALSVKVTCSTMGRVVIRPSADDKSHHHHASISDSAGAGGTAGVHIAEYEDDEDADRSLTKVFHVIAMGFQDGTIRLVDASSGGSVLFGSSLEDGGAWFVNPTLANKRPEDPDNEIVALSFDSSTSYLCALNVRGDAAIFGPLEWGRRSQKVTVADATKEGAQRQQQGLFAAFVGGGTSDERKDTNVDNRETANRVLRPPFALNKPPTSTVRFSYADQQEGCHPVCMALDPAYGRRKERAVLVGFNDGRLIFSKLQGGGVTAGVTSFFGGAAAASTVKKSDSVIYQGMGASSVTSGDKFGIEAIAWRGGLVAWADSSGVRLFDIENMSRIAHIDRPTGARSNLYPTISSLRPSILFERSDSLLIGWGDCLMSMVIRDTKSSAVTKDGSTPKEIKKKAVDCTMAWELDCVACSVVPLDEKHVAVLGLVPSAGSSSSSIDVTAESGFGDSQLAGGDNVIELQVINREDGKSVSNDSLPLVEQVYTNSVDNSMKRIRTGNASEFTLLSSYAVSRMDDLAEWEALDDGERAIIEREADAFGVRRTDKSVSKTFSELHQRWDMTNDVCSSGKEILEDSLAFDDKKDDESTSSQSSSCSDNYVFALSEPINPEILSSDLDHSSRSSPPIMTVVYSYDACLVQTRDVDDVVSYARSMGKSALALKYALAHRRDMRRHELDLLVDNYFSALLRLSSHHAEGKALSFSRVKIAAESLPILLGGDSRMWQRWIFMFARIPGGLFLIRQKIPVRDPHLPTYVFEMTLEKMLEETVNHRSQGNTISGENDVNNAASDKMTDLFLETLRSWGPTSYLRKRIQMQRYYSQKSRNNSPAATFIKQAEKDLQRRISQTAFGVLSDANDSASKIEDITTRQAIDASKDSLFDVDNLIEKFSSRLQLNDKSTDRDHLSSNIFVGRNSDITIIFANAELEMMREKFDRALGYYLSIGSSFMTESLPILEETAVLTVNHSQEKLALAEVTGTKYDHVLSLIEMHQLHYILLNRNYSLVDKFIVEPPIVALIMLVGLSKAGSFLMDCLSPPDTKSDADEEMENTNTSNDSNLPLDAIAAQLASRPKLLYWFLFQVFTKRPDMYVKFPTTSVPPLNITNLHRKQFSLFLDYANESEGEVISEPIASTSVIIDADSPFMSFLRATIPHGGVDAITVRERLGSYRGGRVDNPVFARELAFVTEKFGKGTIEEAKEVLNLYLLGAKNLSMAVAFAERDSKHSKDLWKILVEHCTISDPSSDASEKGALFGSLLEAAAHCGADLSSLVSSIPEGMSIQGLRPKLIAAIADYRHKVRIHEYTADALSEDKVGLLRELCHLSRRGERSAEKKVREDAHKKDVHSSKPSLLQMQRMKSSAATMRHPNAFSLSIR